MITFKQINKSFQNKHKTIEALNDISFHINHGEKFGIIGESGAGKSTLLRLINALESPSRGEVIVDKKSIHKLSKKALRSYKKNVGMIFQQFNLLYNKTVEENISLPLELHSYQDALTVDQVLDFVGLGDKKHQYPSQLSGGQKQRVGIARALITQPQILLCDEPTSALDQNTTEEIIQVLNRAHQQLKMTIVLVTHELNVVKALCDRAAIIEGGRLTGIVHIQKSPVTKTHKTYHQRVMEVLQHDANLY